MNKIITKYDSFINEGLKLPDNYNYVNIVIGIFNQEEQDYIVEYLEKYLDMSTYRNMNMEHYFTNNGGFYIRFGDGDKDASYGPIDQMIHLLGGMGITYEKLFTIDDIKKNKIGNIIKFGHTGAKHMYSPRNITRENSNLIVEKSSLIRLGVPNYIMKYIQKDFAIPSDATWNKIKLKSEAKDILRNEDIALLLQISLNSIKIFVTHLDNKNKKFFLDNYVYRDGAWGGEYEKQPREYLTMTQMFNKIKTESLIYHLQDDFSLIRQPARKRKKAQKEFNEFTEEFKKEFLKNFESILKRIVGAKYNSAKKEIQEKAKKIEIENKMMLSGLSDPLSGPNSLTILDEFLLGFEEEYSDFFGERLDIKELSEYFTRDKIMTSFMYYIYTGKILTK